MGCIWSKQSHPPKDAAFDYNTTHPTNNYSYATDPYSSNIQQVNPYPNDNYITQNNISPRLFTDPGNLNSGIFLSPYYSQPFSPQPQYPSTHYSFSQGSGLPSSGLELTQQYAPPAPPYEYTY